MLEEALELGIEARVVAHAFGVVRLGHPFDGEGRDRHRQRVVGEHRLGDVPRWPDRVDLDRKSRAELLGEAVEQVDVLGLLARELQERADLVVVGPEVRPGLVEHEGKDELLHQAERHEIAVAADLVEAELLFGREKSEPAHAREALGHERLGEVQPLVAADDVLDAPADLLGAGERVFEGEVHGHSGLSLEHGPAPGSARTGLTFNATSLNYSIE